MYGITVRDLGATKAKTLAEAIQEFKDFEVSDYQIGWPDIDEEDITWITPVDNSTNLFL